MTLELLNKIIEHASIVENKYPQLSFSILFRGKKTLTRPLVEIKNSTSYRQTYYILTDIEEFEKFTQLCVDDKEFMRIENE